MINYFEELGIDINLTGEELKGELKRNQRKWIGRTNAPDLNRRQDAEKKVALISEAEEILLDEEKRKEYIEKLNNSHQNNAKIDPFNAERKVNSTNVEELIQEAYDLVAKDRAADAIVLARQATAIEVNNGRAWHVLGYANAVWNNPKEAEDAYLRAIKIDPRNAGYYYDLSNLYLDHNNLNLSFEYAKKAEKLAPEDPYIKHTIANIHEVRYEYDEAIKIYKDLYEKFPDNDSLKELIASNYYDKGLKNCYHYNGYFYNIDPEKTQSMIDDMKKGYEYSKRQEFLEKIKWGEKSLKKTFDKSKISLFAVPAIMFIMEGLLIKVLAIALAVGFGYLCMRPMWRLTRNEILGESTLFDTCSFIVTKTIGVIINIIIGMFKIAFDMVLGSTKRY